MDMDWYWVIHELDEYYWQYREQITTVVMFGVIALAIYRYLLKKEPLSKGIGLLVSVIVFLVMSAGAIIELFLAPSSGLDVATILYAFVYGTLANKILTSGKSRKGRKSSYEEKAYSEDRSAPRESMSQQLRRVTESTMRNPEFKERKYDYMKKSSEKLEDFYESYGSEVEKSREAQAGKSSSDNWSGYTFSCPSCGSTLLNRSKSCFKCGTVFYK